MDANALRLRPLLERRIYDQPHLIHPPKLWDIARVVREFHPRRGEEPQLGLAEALGVEDRSGEDLHITPAGLAVIRLHGTMVQRHDHLNSESGLTSYERTREHLQAALRDDGVHTVLLWASTTGGEGVGGFDLSDEIYAARASKRVVGFTDRYALSAGYLEVSACSEVFLTQDAEVGSVGVYTLHRNLKGAMDAAGVEVTEVYAGAMKAAGSPYRSLEGPELAEIRQDVDDLYEMFLGIVARNRGVSMEAVRLTEARTFRGQKAIDVGFADGIRTLDQLLTELSAPPADQGRKTMTQRPGAGAPPPAPETPAVPEAGATPPVISFQAGEDEAPATLAARLQATFPQATAHIRGLELQRQEQIRALAFPGQEALALELATDPKMTPEAAAVRFNELRKAQDQKARLERDDQEVAGLSSTVGDEDLDDGFEADPELSAYENRVARAWHRDPSLRKQFGEKKFLLGYLRARPHEAERLLGR